MELKNSLHNWCVKNDRKDILEMWYQKENGNVTPHDISYGSEQKYAWRCSNGHIFYASPHSRTSGSGKCGLCKLSEKWDFSFVPKTPSHKPKYSLYNWCIKNNKTDLLNAWYQDKNGTVTPKDVEYNSHDSYWWLCPSGHITFGSVYYKTQKNVLCSFCEFYKERHHNKFASFANHNGEDLTKTHPHLVKQWHPYRNLNDKPEFFTSASDHSAWWVCDCGFVWEEKIKSRVSRHSVACPKCSKYENGTSFPEYILLFYLSKYTNVIHRFSDYGFEIDLFLPDKKIGIEFDGYETHKDKKEDDLKKNMLCKFHGIKLYRIREAPLPLLNNYSIDFQYTKSNKNLIVKELVSALFETNDNIDVEKDTINIEFFRVNLKRSQTFNTNIDIIKEFAKNDDIMFHPNSPLGKIRLFKCPVCNYEWRDTIGNFSNSAKCPHCNYPDF